MSTGKTLTSALIGFWGTVALIVLWMFLPTATRAQCGDIESSCYKCHRAVHPVCGTTEWHSVFGHRYACWNCHGGNDVALDKEQAHVGLVANPLEDVYTSCYSCHPNDYRQRAEQLTNELGVPVSSREPTPTTRAPTVAVASQPLVLPPPSASVSTNTSLDWLQAWWWLLPLAAVVPLGWFVWKRQNRHSV